VVRSDDSWCDDVRTDARESCEETLGLALAEAVGELAGRQGGEQAAWRWGRENEVVFPHLPLHLARWLRPFFSRRVGAGGDALTVNPVMRSGDRLIISSYRQVVDLADLDASRFVTTLGQSGHVLSRNYDDMLERWRAGGYVPMRFSRAAVDAAARGRLELTP
jgi:penicillin amidase